MSHATALSDILKLQTGAIPTDYGPLTVWRYAGKVRSIDFPATMDCFSALREGYAVGGLPIEDLEDILEWELRKHDV